MLKLFIFILFFALAAPLAAMTIEPEAPKFISVFEPARMEFKAKIIRKSIEFERYKNSLPLPKGLVKIESSLPSEKLSLIYRGQIYGFHKGPRGESVAFYEASPFEHQKAKIFFDGAPISSLSFKAQASKAEGNIIDPSCWSYHVEVKGMEDEIISLGCERKIMGEPGDENIVLQALWTAPGWKPVGQEEGIHVLNLYGKASAPVEVENEQGERKTFIVKASAPKERYRLGVALGFGPYHFLSQGPDKTYDDGGQFMYMLYAGLALTEKHSFKLFDAYIEKEATFNNFGFYFSSDIAKLLDDRLVFNTLLGFQDLLFELPEGDKQHKIIYPQGIEMILSHPFGLKNYKFMLGGFIGGGGSQEYSNVWVRFGKGMFYELNYLKWAEGETNAEAFGLSVGIPLFRGF